MKTQAVGTTAAVSPADDAAVVRFVVPALCLPRLTG